jgi:O-methyltransferase involved in polyketide biosynthesis
MSEPVIQNVSDTAFMVAVYRAMESERPDALFHDTLPCIVHFLFLER